MLQQHQHHKQRQEISGFPRKREEEPVTTNAIRRVAGFIWTPKACNSRSQKRRKIGGPFEVRHEKGTATASPTSSITGTLSCNAQTARPHRTTEDKSSLRQTRPELGPGNVPKDQPRMQARFPISEGHVHTTHTSAVVKPTLRPSA